MVRSRTITAVAGLAVGVVVSLAVWVIFETLLVFLFLPFIPLLFARGGSDGSDAASRSRQEKQCPECAFRTTEPEFEYCPRDGRRLREQRRS